MLINPLKIIFFIIFTQFWNIYVLPDDGFADREGSLLKYFSKIQASATFSVEYGLQANLMVVLEIEDETRVETFEVANDAQNMLVNRSSGFVPLALNALQWLLLFTAALTGSLSNDDDDP